MSSITSINRVSLWSIQIHSNASTKLEPSRNDVKAGFVCCDGLGISTNTIFEDLKIIYPSLHYCPDEFKLALWQERDDGSAEFTSAADGNKEFRMATDSPKLILGLIFHNKSHPLCTVLTDSATITHHINAGCAVVPNLNFDPQENGHLPDTQNYFIPSARSSRPSTPSQKRKFAEDSTSGQSTPASLESPRKQDQDSRMFIESLGVDTRSFEKSVKGSYSKCVITNTDSKWGTLICGPGPDYENYPFKVTPSYNTHENGLRQRMQSTWEPANGLLLRADIHDMFDRRMIAIHPITFQIRLFAPMSVAMEYHGKVIEWETIPDRAALAYHYSQCVIENVAAGLVSASKFVVPENWKQAINMISQLALNRRLQELRDQVGDGSADDATYYLEDGLTKGREEEIESWLERYNNT